MIIVNYYLNLGEDFAQISESLYVYICTNINLNSKLRLKSRYQHIRLRPKSWKLELQPPSQLSQFLIDYAANGIYRLYNANTSRSMNYFAEKWLVRKWLPKVKKKILYEGRLLYLLFLLTKSCFIELRWCR
jgi:hypothetical protein